MPYNPQIRCHLPAAHLYWMSYAMTALCTQTRPRGRPRRAFTLLETAMATIIIGVGVMGVMQLLAKSTALQINSVDTAVAVNLANNIHEMTLNLYFADPVHPANWGLEAGETLATADDLDDFDGAVFSPPIDARRQPLANFANWSQSVTVQSVDPNRLTTTVPNGSTPTERVTVSVSHFGQVVYQESWLNASPY
jgi:type II secretory pathway pseudopilin PulG